MGRLASFLPRKAPAPHELELAHLARAEYDALWQETFGHRTGPERNYFETHRERYYELFNSLVRYFPDRGAAIGVLEAGVSEYASFYKRLYPDMRLVTLDRPVADQGADANWSRTLARAERHYNVNLNTETIGPNWGEPPMGRFDLVVCTEVIEHLILHPVELLEQLLSLLRPEGLLYLTTPNFFRSENLAKIARRENPQAIYPRRGQNWDAHHHFREMTMQELLEFTRDAGGRVVASYYSACWDGEAVRSGPVEERSNLVLVAAAGGGS